MTGDDTAALIDHLYDAALDETLWTDALGTYAERFGGVGTVILEPGKAAPVIAISSGLVDSIDAYQREWWPHDLVLATAHRLDLFHPGVSWSDDYIPDEVKRKSFFFQDFLAKHGIGGNAATIAQSVGGATLAINVQRRLGLAPAEASERRRFTEVSRHLVRALAVRTRLDRADAIGASLARQLSNFDCAVAILDDAGRVIDVNEAFSSLAGSGMTVRGGRIRIGAAAHQLRFDEASRAIVTGTRGSDVPDTLIIPRPSSLLPLLVRLVPFAAGTAERFALRRRAHGALVLVIDPSHASYPDLDGILVKLGLTRTQARVAVLIASGHSVRDAAQVLAVREETVRSHVKGILGRLGLAKQSDIVRLVTRAAPFKG